MFKTRPEINIGIKQIENGVKSTVGRQSSMSRYPRAFEDLKDLCGWSNREEGRALQNKTCYRQGSHDSELCKPYSLVSKFMVKLASILKVN